MLYNFLGIDEKTQRNLLKFDQNVRTVYSNIRTVYPSKDHVTTYPDLCHFFLNNTFELLFFLYHFMLDHTV